MVGRQVARQQRRQAITLGANRLLHVLAALREVYRLVVVVYMSLVGMLAVNVDVRHVRMGERRMIMLVAVPRGQVFERARSLAPVMCHVPVLVLMDRCFV